MLDGYACWVYLNDSIFHTALPAAVSLNDNSFERDHFELVYLEGNILKSGGEVATIVVAAVVLVLLIALIPGGLGQFWASTSGNL